MNCPDCGTPMRIETIGGWHFTEVGPWDDIEDVYMCPKCLATAPIPPMPITVSDEEAPF